MISLVMTVDDQRRIIEAMNIIAETLNCTMYDVLQELRGSLLSEEEVENIITTNQNAY